MSSLIVTSSEVDCVWCSNCPECTGCYSCEQCVNCTRCEYCIDCLDSTDCINCDRCTLCTNCVYCYGIYSEVDRSGIMLLNSKFYKVIPEEYEYIMDCLNDPVTLNEYLAGISYW